ncbi:hypothetical protein RvY_00061 [Ramazzottius varieornatus]|uniref:EF-hand domain-containing protein n=1 Tax=Ramazzottius varieornatus TaxID=947166 RepID=A0A1D1UBB8_RAMVA|nr:hypothetical protein RvY_00061 [Ramazzottius varieornatus]
MVHLKEIQTYQRSIRRLAPIQCIQDAGQKVQLKTLFQYIIDRDLPNVHKFHNQGFPGIFQAHEDKTGNTVMHVAAYKNDLELIDWLLNEGSEIDARNRAGVTPMMVAVHHGYFDLVRLLASKEGSDLNAEDRFGQNLLWYCFGGTERYGQIAAFCLNTKKPVEPTSNLIGKPILVRACEKGNKARDIVELLIRSGCNVDEAAVRTGRTPLIEAARRGASGVIQLLLQEGADPDLVDHKQVHSTHEAVYHGHVEALQVLASAGAHLDSPAHHGNTPLHLAVAAQQLPAVRFLTHRGANPNTKNSLGMTVKQLAKKYGLKAVSKEMKKAEKQRNGVGNKFAIEFYDWFQENTDVLRNALQTVSTESESQDTENPILGNTDPDSVTKEQLSTVLQSLSVPVKEEELPELIEALDSKKTGALTIADIFKAAEKIVPKAFLKSAYSADSGKKGKGKKGKGKKKRAKLKLPKGLKISICIAEEEESPMAFKNSLHVAKHVVFGDKVVSGLTRKEQSTPFTSDNIWRMEQSAVETCPVNDLCRDGDWESVARACKKGLDVNQCDKLYKTPLMYAAAAGRWDMVKMLLAYGYTT